MGRVILISSPKGGTGKSALARHLLVSAQQAGLRVIGVDYDSQGSFHKWAMEREGQRKEGMNLQPSTVYAAELKNWRAAFERAAGADLTIIDTPPSVENHLGEMGQLSDLSHLTIVPCGCTHDDVQSVSPWVAALGRRGARSVVVLNKANPRMLSFKKFRSQMLAVGDVCPVEIPLLEDFHAPSEYGLTLLDINKSRGHEAARDLWQFVSRAVGLVEA